MFHRFGGYHTGKLDEKHWVWVVWPTLEALAWGSFVIPYASGTWDLPKPLSRMLSWLGSLSFSLYVSHWIFVNPTPWHRWLPLLSTSYPTAAILSVLLFVLPVIVLFSWLLYTVIEKPFFELRKTYLK
jgi:peptidoglycan/LPS O-acetylase OafA/YrhL